MSAPWIRLGLAWILLTFAGRAAAASPPKGKSPAAPALTAPGEALAARYATQLAELRDGIARATAVVDEGKRAAFLAAREKIKAVTADAEAARKAAGGLQTAKALVDHAKGKWIGGAEKGIAQAQAALKAATTAAERAAAEKELATWQANKAEGEQALRQRLEAYEKAKLEDARLKEVLARAESALAQALADETTAAQAVLAEAGPFLHSDKLDARLATATVYTVATPRGLAEFAQRGPEQESLLASLLSRPALLKEMLEAGGASGGKYGEAAAIYSRIRKGNPKSGEGTLQRLAMAVALEHAVPVPQANAEAETGAPAVVDPVKRYRHYEQAFAAGELDPGFGGLSTWELRQVVSSDAPDEVLAWGRDMLRNYRPDHLHTANDGWRYSALVKTDVLYGSQDVDKDRPDLHPYQNQLLNGGVCGRRAFFGRFLLNSFGVPVWGVTQHKHAAVGRWTPKGWLVNLGAGFDHSWWDKDGGKRSGADFLLETQARRHERDYVAVQRAQWIGAVLGEPAYNERTRTPGGFWSALAHFQARQLARQAVTLGPVGQDVAESNESTERHEPVKVEITAVDRSVQARPDGSLLIPAVALAKPSRGLVAMPAAGGGAQLHCSRELKAEQVFEYVFDAPRAGAYALTARVVTVQADQKLRLAANGAREPVEIPVPYTMGRWGTTTPVTVSLVQGRNVLRFSRPAPNRGVTIRDFLLKPSFQTSSFPATSSTPAGDAS